MLNIILCFSQYIHKIITCRNHTCLFLILAYSVPIVVMDASGCLSIFPPPSEAGFGMRFTRSSTQSNTMPPTSLSMLLYYCSGDVDCLTPCGLPSYTPKRLDQECRGWPATCKSRHRSANIFPKVHIHITYSILHCYHHCPASTATFAIFAPPLLSNWPVLAQRRDCPSLAAHPPAKQAPQAARTHHFCCVPTISSLVNSTKGINAALLSTTMLL